MARSATAHASRHHHGRRPVDSGRSASGQVVGVLLLVFGLGWFLRVAGVIDLKWESLLSVVLIVLGIGMALTARARSGGFLMVLGIFLTISLATTSSVSDLGLTGGVGERRILVTSEPDEPYRQLAGQLTLDLREFEADSESSTVQAKLRFGELVVVVPAEIDVEVSAEVRGGELNLLGQESRGSRLNQHADYKGTDPEAGVLVLDLYVGFGDLTVRRAPSELPGRSGGEDAPR